MTPLHHVGDWLRTVLLAIPLPAVRGLFVILLAVILIWVLRLPREETTPEQGRPVEWGENLKVWAALALLIQIAMYALV